MSLYEDLKPNIALKVSPGRSGNNAQLFYMTALFLYGLLNSNYFYFYLNSNSSAMHCIFSKTNAVKSTSVSYIVSCIQILENTQRILALEKKVIFAQMIKLFSFYLLNKIKY